MYCPDCREEMIVLEVDKVEVDFCLKCEGIWLDEGELEILLEGIDESRKFIESFQVDKKSTEKKRKCPVCHKKMDKISINKTTSAGTVTHSLEESPEVDEKMIIDSCRRKHGIWFDQGELFKTLDLGGLKGNPKVYQLIKDLLVDSNSG